MHHAIRAMMRWQVYWAMMSAGKLWVHAMLLSGVPKSVAFKMLSDRWDDIKERMY
jgi:hypothetical protein